jgi:hypothetical protein
VAVDKWFGIAPWGLIVGIVLGSAVGLYRIRPHELEDLLDPRNPRLTRQFREFPVKISGFAMLESRVFRTMALRAL